MNLDFFNNFSNNTKENNFSLKFIDELTNYLGNARKNILENQINQNLSDFLSINDLISKYKISYDFLENFYEKSFDFLKEYSKNIDNSKSVYCVSWNNNLNNKYDINNIYTINQYKDGKELEKIYLTGANLPKNVKTGMLLKNNYEIDISGSKIVSTQLEKIAEEIANLQENNLQKYRKEDNLYVVIQKNIHSAYLQDMKTNTVFEEVNFSSDTFNLMCNDAVVRFKNGKYAYEDQLTRKNMY